VNVKLGEANKHGDDISSDSCSATENGMRCFSITEAMKLVTHPLEGDTRLHPKVSGMAAWSENCKLYSPLPLDVVVALFCGSV
jgi:hypothetical protein